VAAEVRSSGSLRVLAVIPARNEALRVGATVRATRRIPGVDEVVVVADGSTDGTAEGAHRAGARVLMAAQGVGKGGALEAAIDRSDPADVYLFLDGDLAESAGRGEAVLEEVAEGRADLAIGVLPREPRHGGFRLVKRFAAAAIRQLTGFRSEEPLSGQRAMTSELLEAVRPLAPGFAVEVAMTIDAVRAGFRVVDVPVDMEHDPTGRDLASFVHRGRQGLAVLRAALPRILRRP
jgi:glycosyltransferase involved in cell wall biosynthesis